jgi:Arc-like DNA binding domain
VPSQHKHLPISYRPPAELREWLYAHAEATGRSVGSILTQALEEARRAAHLDNSTEDGVTLAHRPDDGSGAG